jgi:hypothetical protein
MKGEETTAVAVAVAGELAAVLERRMLDYEDWKRV